MTNNNSRLLGAALIGLVTVTASGVAQVRPTSQAGSNWGQFVGTVETRWENDGRNMTMLRDFAFIEPNGTTRWDARSSSVIDGASIPQWAWSIVGGPFEGKYRNASVVHDVACDTKARPWKKTHRMFYTAARAGGTDMVRAKVMYGAIYHFGPRWPDPRLPLAYSLRQGDENDLARLRQFIEDRPDVSLDSIDRVTSRGLIAAEPQIRQTSRRPPQFR